MTSAHYNIVKCPERETLLRFLAFATACALRFLFVLELFYLHRVRFGVGEACLGHEVLGELFESLVCLLHLWSFN